MHLDAGIGYHGYYFYSTGTVYKTKHLEDVYDYKLLPAYRGAARQTRPTYAESFYVQYCNTDPFTGKRLVEPYHGNKSMWYRTRLQSP